MQTIYTHTHTQTDTHTQTHTHTHTHRYTNTININVLKCVREIQYITSIYMYLSVLGMQNRLVMAMELRMLC